MSKEHLQMSNLQHLQMSNLQLRCKSRAGEGRGRTTPQAQPPSPVPPGPSEMQLLSHSTSRDLNLSWLRPVNITTSVLSEWFSQNAVSGRLPFEQFQFLTEMLQRFISTQLRSQPAHVRVKNRKCYPLVCSDVPADIVTGCILRRILFNTSVFKYKAVGCSSFRKHKYPFFCCTVSVCEIL